MDTHSIPIAPGLRLLLPSGAQVQIIEIKTGGRIDCGYVRHGVVVPIGHNSGGRVCLPIKFLREHAKIYGAS